MTIAGKSYTLHKDGYPSALCASNAIAKMSEKEEDWKYVIVHDHKTYSYSIYRGH